MALVLGLIALQGSMLLREWLPLEPHGSFYTRPGTAGYGTHEHGAPGGQYRGVPRVAREGPYIPRTSHKIGRAKPRDKTGPV